jgi:hypothetical protein
MRLQESFWLAQLAKQASLAASANRNLPIETLPWPAAAVPISSRDNAALSTSFMDTSGYTAFAVAKDAYARRRRLPSLLAFGLLITNSSIL